MIKTLISPEEISTLARPCYADEEKALAYIVEAEQNNIKPAIGDDLFIQLKEGGQTFLLEGGVYERNGKRYELNGIKKALAYFVISRLYESSTIELTRQGVVNRRSEFSDNADERDIISASRETYAIANRYMEEVEKYLGTDVKNTSQRVRFDLVGGGSNVSRQCRPSSSSGGASPSANINVVHVLGNSDKDVISQAGVTREFNAVREEADEKLAEAKAYTDEEIAKATIGGGGDIDLSDYAKIAYVDDKVQKAKDYTDEKFNNINIPTELSELSDDADHRLVTDVEKQRWDDKSDFSGDYNDLENKPTIPDVSGFVKEDELGEFVNAIAVYVETKANKTSVITSDDINSVTLDWDKEYHFTMMKDTLLDIYDKPNDEYTHSIEIEMTTGEETYSFSTNLEIQWVKDLEIEANKRYMIIIDDSMTAMWAAVERSDNE
jgi:hypothetical protein